MNIRGYHVTLFKLLVDTANLGIVAHVFQTLELLLPTFVYAGEDLSVRNQNLEGLLDDVLAKNQLSRTAELPQWSDLLQLSRQNIVFNDGFPPPGEVATRFFPTKRVSATLLELAPNLPFVGTCFFSKNVSSQFNPKLFSF